VLTTAEKEQREDMIFLGQAISKPAPVAVRLLAEQFVSVLSDVSFSVPVKIIKTDISTSMALCDGYRAEIDATIEFVDKNLKDHGITYYFRSGSRRN
jgi:hypothetical protein